MVLTGQQHPQAQSILLIAWQFSEIKWKSTDFWPKSRASPWKSPQHQAAYQSLGMVSKIGVFNRERFPKGCRLVRIFLHHRKNRQESQGNLRIPRISKNSQESQEFLRMRQESQEIQEITQNRRNFKKTSSKFSRNLT